MSFVLAYLLLFFAFGTNLDGRVRTAASIAIAVSAVFDVLEYDIKNAVLELCVLPKEPAWSAKQATRAVLRKEYSDLYPIPGQMQFPITPGGVSLGASG